MKEKEKLYAKTIRLTGKSTAVEELVYCIRNMTVVKEEFCQFNDQLKLLMSLHEELHSILEVEEEKMESDEWIDMVV